MRRHILLSTLFVSVSPVLAAAPVDYLGGMFTESFNNPGFNAMGNTTVAIEGETALAGWETNASDDQIQFGWGGAVSAGRLYGYRFDSSGETSPTAGALGSRTTSATGPIQYALGLVNATGGTITRFNLSFAAFVAHYKDASTDKLTLAYGIGPEMGAVAYTEIPEATYVPPAGSGRGNPVDGTREGFSVSREGLAWKPGETLWLRWTDHQDEAYGSMGLGIDHIRFSTDADRIEPYTEWEFPEDKVTELLIVDQAHPEADDANPGTAELPLKRIRAAVQIADGHSSDGKGTRIRIYPGVYREVVDITSRSGNLPLVIESAGEGEVVISGSDIFADWTASEIENVYQHAWPYNFGWEPNPWPGSLALKYPDGTRRELLFLNKNPLTQVVHEDELAEGTYLVDEEADRVLMYPPVGFDPVEDLVEISVRPENLYGVDSKLMRVFRVNNVAVRGLVFEHAAAGSLANDAAVAFRGCSNIIFEDITLRWNNGFGASFSEQGETPGENYLVRNFTNIGSGALGMDGGGISNIRFEGGEIRFANWRGALWGATGWAPCGFKFASYHGMHMTDYVISQSHASGVWMDTNNRDVLFERVYSVNNYRSGFSLEANYGPITIRDSIIYGNSTGINGFDNSGVIIENTLIANNEERQIRFAGSHPLSEEELLEYPEGWSRERQRQRHIPRNWTLQDNLIGSTDTAGSAWVFQFGLRSGSFKDNDGNPVFRVFADTYEGSGNAFHLAGSRASTGFPDLLNNGISFGQWVDSMNEVEAVAVSLDSLQLALDEASALVGEPAEGFSGLDTAVPVITVSVESPVAREDGSEAGRFRITRDGGDPAQPVLVVFSLTGSALMGTDYSAVEESLLLQPGEASGVVTITALEDGLPEFEESVRLEVSADIDGIYKLGNPSSGQISIADVDAVVPASVDEQLGIGSGIVTNPIILSNPSAGVLELEVRPLSMEYPWSSSTEDPDFDFKWIEPGGDANAVNFNWQATNNDGLSGPVPLGFAFPFFGGSHSDVRIHSNGFLTFAEPADPAWRFTFLKELPESEDLPAGTMIAPFWSDLAMDSESSVSWFRSGDRFVVTYAGLYRYGVFGAKQRMTFQVILYASGEIRFQYREIGYTSPSWSIGLMGAGNSAGLSLAYNEPFIGEGMAVRLVPPAAWLSVNPETFSLAASGTREMELNFHPGNVLAGEYGHVLRLADSGTGEVLFNIPVELSVGDTNHLLENSWIFEAYRWSSWFGTYSSGHEPWLYHYGPARPLGWLYAVNYEETGLWLYSLDAGGWIWTSKLFYPWLWSPGKGWHW